VNVDMATYKAEFLAHHYKRRLRPRAHYTLGWLPVYAALVERLGLAGVVNAVSRAPLLPRLATRAAGLEPRKIPLFARQSLREWWKGHDRSAGSRGTVLLWPDTFTNHFHPHIGQAAVAVMEDAGWSVILPEQPLCCGLTWISTGQLDTAKKVLRRTVAALADHMREGGLVVGLEPSCTAVFRSDAAELLPEDLDVKRLEAQTVTLAELLTKHSPGWTPPPLPGAKAIAQVHCHQHAVMRWDSDSELLEACGVDTERLDSGCCGLAGNFGFERGHQAVSRACAEAVLLPAVRRADAQTAVLADGFSCRTQITEFSDTDHVPLHLAELLASGLARRGDK
jgi:Fe-S oxidoreductase